MAKVDIGKLRKMFNKEPDIAATVAYGTRMIMCNTETFGDFATFIIYGHEDGTPEIIMRKDELLRFAREIEAKLGGQNGR